MSAKSLTLLGMGTMLLALVISIFDLQTVAQTSVLGYDLKIYLEATNNALLNSDVYNILYANVAFNYPPSLFIFVIPFLFLPYTVTFWMWTFMSLLSLFLSIYLCFKLYIRPVPIYYVLLTFAVFTSLFPTQMTLEAGQLNLITLFLMTASFYKLHTSGENQQIISGLLLGVAGALKLIPLFLIFYYLYQKKYVSVVITILTFIFFNLIIVLWGIKLSLVGIYLANISHVVQLLPNSWALTAITNGYDQSLTSFFINKFGEVLDSSRNYLVISATIFNTSITLLLAYFRSKSSSGSSGWPLFSALLIIATLFPTPFTWEHHLVWLYPAVWLCIVHMLKKPSVLLAGFCILIVILISLNGGDSLIIFNTFIGNWKPDIISFHGLIAGILLLFYAWKNILIIRNRI